LEGYCSCPKLFNSHALPLSRYPINPSGSITYLLEFEGLLHSFSKTSKESNTLVGVIYKYHGLNYFGSSYWKGITHA